MTEFFPRLWETHYDRQVGCDPLGKQTEHMFPTGQQVHHATSGVTMRLLWPGCFASVRRKLDIAVGFGRSIRDFRPFPRDPKYCLFNTWSEEVPTHSPGPPFHPEQCSDCPGEAENYEKTLS
ncbi:unnamed protein product [Prorocentrum cordatum]|uniref:Uncharacterized protein n=1 Tax=Prorocentrum cordatum TaxID=2364126 RepID=A0ABN9XQU8_9DINO|nr:unnamed protein product [Polarella glacialis]